MIEDIVEQDIVTLQENQAQITAIFQQLLVAIEDQVLSIGGNKLHTYGLPEVVRSASWNGIEHEREAQHTNPQLTSLAEDNFYAMTAEQQDVYNDFLEVFENFSLGLDNERNMMFLGARLVVQEKPSSSILYYMLYVVMEKLLWPHHPVELRLHCWQVENDTQHLQSTTQHAYPRIPNMHNF
jgi:hypothetical protein